MVLLWDSASRTWVFPKIESCAGSERSRQRRDQRMICFCGRGGVWAGRAKDSPTGRGKQLAEITEPEADYWISGAGFYQNHGLLEPPGVECGITFFMASMVRCGGQDFLGQQRHLSFYQNHGLLEPSRVECSITFMTSTSTSTSTSTVRCGGQDFLGQQRHLSRSNNAFVYLPLPSSTLIANTLRIPTKNAEHRWSSRAQFAVSFLPYTFSPAPSSMHSNLD